MSILLRRRMLQIGQSDWNSPILFDSGLNKGLWAIGYRYNSSCTAQIGDVLQSSTVSTGQRVSLYFVRKLNLAEFSAINLTYASDSSSRAANLWMALTTDVSAIINEDIIYSPDFRWQHVHNNATSTNGKTYSWNFKSAVHPNSALPYSDDENYYVVIASSSYNTSNSTRISKVWLE